MGWTRFEFDGQEDVLAEKQKVLGQRMERQELPQSASVQPHTAG